jgi:hypothetical protein
MSSGALRKWTSMTSSGSVSLDLVYDALMPSKFQRQSHQNTLPAEVETSIPIVWGDAHAFVQYAALSLGPYKSP